VNVSERARVPRDVGALPTTVTKATRHRRAMARVSVQFIVRFFFVVSWLRREREASDVNLVHTQRASLGDHG
jgi:hypothetical protein